MLILTCPPHTFSYGVKVDTRGSVFDLSFNNRILMLILIGYTHGPLVLKQVMRNTFFDCLKTILNLNSNFH